MALYLYGIVRWPVPWDVNATPSQPAGAKKRRAATQRSGAGKVPGGAAAEKTNPDARAAAARAGATAQPPGLGAGVGDPPRPVQLLRHQDLAALVSVVAPGEVSDQNVRAMRRDMKAHSAVLNHVVGLGVPSLLPVRFGIVFPAADALLQRLLAPQYGVLLDFLRRLEGAAEVSLKVTYIEQRVLQEVVAEQPQLARPAVGGYQAKIDVGRRVAEALRAKQDNDARWLLTALTPAARDVRVGKTASDLMVLNASFLVEQKSLPKFDRVLEKVNAEAGHLMRFDCVGPLPPYSFADLRL